MKPIMEIANMLTKFMSQKASLLSSLPILIAMPIRPRSNKVGPLTDQPIIFIGLEQRLEVVPIRLNPKQAKRKSRNQGLALWVTALVGVFSLAGCTGSTYSSHFDCPMGEGAGCASISRVNKLIDRQEIDLGNDDAPFARGAEANSASSNQASPNQVYVYYGPDQLSRLIPTDKEA